MCNTSILIRAGLWLAYGVVLTSCGGGYSDESAPPPAVQAPVVPAIPQTDWHGAFAVVSLSGSDYYEGEGVITEDGAVRFYLARWVQVARNGDRQVEILRGVQFVGQLSQQSAATAIADGIVVGMQCAEPDSVSYCSVPETRSLTLRRAGDLLTGELILALGATTQTWTVRLLDWDFHYGSQARLENLVGQYSEHTADFSRNVGTIITVDGNGRMFVQGAAAGCVGTGSLRARGNGRYNVFDVELLVENCAAPYLYLNGDFSGLATTLPSNIWNYDDGNLHVWLTKAGAATSPAGLVMHGTILGGWDY